jgi:hypothetical protein
MKTLKEIVDFVGIPQGSLASARYQYSEPWTMGVNNVNLLVTQGARPASMRNIIQILQNLTPITLEAEIIGSLSGEEPFEPKTRVNASGGITWFTTIEFSLLGVPNAPVYSHDVSNSGGDFTPTQLAPGRWYLSVIRSGISNSGFVSLRKQLGTVTVSARPQPTPPPPPPLVKPSINVRSNGDGSFVVSGSKFLPNTTVHIRVVDAASTTIWFSQTSTPEGKIEDFPTGRICQLPGQLFFSANDGRSNPQDLTGTLWSNTVTTTCPF